MKKKGSLNIRIYYKDTDAGGVVYHTRYAEFMEMARTELLREAGITAEELVREYGILVPVIDMSLKFKSPARYDDVVTVRTEIIELTPTRLVCDYEIVNQTATVLVTASTTNCAVRSRGFKITQFPKDLLEQLHS